MIVITEDPKTNKIDISIRIENAKGELVQELKTPVLPNAYSTMLFNDTILKKINEAGKDESIKGKSRLYGELYYLALVYEELQDEKTGSPSDAKMMAFSKTISADMVYRITEKVRTLLSGGSAT